MSELTDEQVTTLAEYRENDAIIPFLEACANDNSAYKKTYELADHQKAMLQAIWDYSFTYTLMARRMGKTFVLGDIALILAALLSGMDTQIKIGIFSGSYRQVKFIFHETQKLWLRSLFLQSITDGEPKVLPDHCELRLKGYNNLPGNVIVGYPLSSKQGSETLRGLGINILIIDEFQIVPESSYAVLFPTTLTDENPMEAVRRLRDGTDETYADTPGKNRLVLSGTAYYDFAPAYTKYYEFSRFSEANKLAKNYIDTGQLDDRFFDLVPDKVMPEDVDHYIKHKWSTREYCTISFPYTIAPEGWYKENFLQLQLQTMSEDEIRREFLCEWIADSDGPYKASLLEHATDPTLEVEFTAGVTSGEFTKLGTTNYYYIIGCDPAFKSSMFATVVLKVTESGVQIVAVQAKKNLPTPEQVEFVKELIARYSPCKFFACDAQGGGYSLASYLEQAEPKYLPIDSEEMDEEAEKMVILKNMNNQWVAATNNRLIADMEHNKVTIAGVSNDAATYDIYAEVQDLKSELVKLRRFVVGGTIKYDLPEKGSRHSHDRWSALTQAYGAYIDHAMPLTSVEELPTGFWL